MELCVMIEGQEGVSWPQWQAIAAACEQHRIPALFRSDHYLPLGGHEERQVLDAWGTLCGLAATTTTLRLGTLVSPGTFRHPSEYAKLVATADHISGGRIEAGLGAGWNEREHAAYGFPFPGSAERFERYEEQLEIVRGLWGPGPFTFAGKHYRLDSVDAQPKPRQDPMPLIVGGRGKPRTIALAARFASEYNIVFAGADECRERRAAVLGAWEQAGRDPAGARFSLMTGLVVGRDAAQLDARRARLAAEHGVDEIPDGWVCGAVDDVATALGAIADAGVDRVMLQLLLHDELDQIAVIGELAPALS